MTGAVCVQAWLPGLFFMTAPAGPRERSDLSPRSSDRSSDMELSLIRSAQGGDHQAFEELFRRHVDMVYRRLTRLVGPDPEREDLVQEVFISAYRGIAGFRGDASFSTWLYRILVRVAFTHLRRGRHQPTQQAAELDDRTLPAEPGESPEARAARHQEVAQVLHCLDRIKPKKRIAFVLRVVEGLSLEEIGDMVKANPAAVGQRIKHAQRELCAMVAHEALHPNPRSLA